VGPLCVGSLDGEMGYADLKIGLVKELTMAAILYMVEA
jgi:hypothetical protein